MSVYESFNPKHIAEFYRYIEINNIFIRETKMYFLFYISCHSFQKCQKWSNSSLTSHQGANMPVFPVKVNVV